MSNREGPYKPFLMDADGGGQVLLSDLPIGMPGTKHLNASLVVRWSPQGERIAFIVPGETGNSLWSVRPDGGGARELLDNVDGFDWYLDATRALYGTRERESGRMTLLAVDLETGEQREIFTGAHAEIDVSPDGRAVAFCVGPSHLGMKPRVLELEPPADPGGLPRTLGGARPLYPGGGRWHVHHVAWSPHSETLLFTHDTDYADVFILDEDN